MEHFFTTSKHIQNIIKSFQLTKTLYVSSVIVGEEHIGKKVLAKYLFPDAFLVSGENQQEVERALEEHDELIITDFEKLRNQESLNFDNKRIIATANYVANPSTIDSIFAFIYSLPPLRERIEDAEYIKNLFTKIAIDDLMLEDKDLTQIQIPLDLSKNSKSLKSTIYKYLMTYTMNKEDIQNALSTYLHKNLDGNNAYKEHLELFEKPLIEVGLKKYGSQLKLANILGINRNTLRKKIHEHRID